MILEISEKEKEILKHILEFYLGELREEVVKTEDVKWKPPLHEEEDMIKKLIAKVS
jgi:hypothetical protein